MDSIEIVTPAMCLVPQKLIRRLKSVPIKAEIAYIANIPLQIYNYRNGECLKKLIVKIKDKIKYHPSNLI